MDLWNANAVYSTVIKTYVFQKVEGLKYLLLVIQNKASKNLWVWQWKQPVDVKYQFINHGVCQQYTKNRVEIMEKLWFKFEEKMRWDNTYVAKRLSAKIWKKNCSQPQWEANNSKHNQQQLVISYSNFSCFIALHFSKFQFLRQDYQMIWIQIFSFYAKFCFQILSMLVQHPFGFRFSFFSNFGLRFRFLAWQRKISSSVAEKNKLQISISIQLQNKNK